MHNFEVLCKKHPSIIQEMADDGFILDPDVIMVCLKNGIKFKAEFLEKRGFNDR